MMVSYELNPGTKLTPAQIQMLEDAQKYPIVFDEDSPELTPEMRDGFRRAVRERNLRLKGRQSGNT